MNDGETLISSMTFSDRQWRKAIQQSWAQSLATSSTPCNSRGNYHLAARRASIFFVRV